MAGRSIRSRNRVRTSPDVRRMAAAVSHPGIDPREWLKLMTVTEVGYDADEGIFVDLQDQISGVEETAYLGSSYAGAEFGFHFPVNVDDTVLVANPGGDPGLGPVIICRWNNSGDKPPSDFQDTTDTEDATRDVVLRVQPQQSLRIRTSEDEGSVDIQIEGDGTLLIEAQGSGEMRIRQAGTGNIILEAIGSAAKVFLGGDSGTEPTTLATTLTNFLNQIKNVFDNHIHTTTATPGTSPTPGVISPPTSPWPSVPDISADEVESR